MIYEFDPRKERFAIEIGIPNKLERLDKIPRPRQNETVGMCINWNVFDWVKSFDGYGEIENEGKQTQKPIPAFPSMSFKNGKLVYGDLPNADMGAGIAMTLVLDGKVNIINTAKMATSKNHRTACGQLKTGNIVFVTVDSMTTQELAEYMLKLGCVNAFQGDSGGSTGYFDGKELHDQGRAIAGALVAYRKIEKVNVVVAYSQQHNNKCAEGDTETDHMYVIAKAFSNILSQDKRLNVYLIPQQNTGSDIGNLKSSIELSNDFIEPFYKDKEPCFHIEFHSDAGTYAKGCSALYKSEMGKKLATYLYNELADLTPTPDAGIRMRTDLGALNQTLAVATVLEVSFHDNIEQAEWIHDEFNSIAVRSANGFYKFLKGECLI